MSEQSHDAAQGRYPPTDVPLDSLPSLPRPSNDDSELHRQPTPNVSMNVNPSPRASNDEPHGNRHVPLRPSFTLPAHVKYIGPMDPYTEIPNLGFDHWQKCAEAVEKHDNNMCKDWKEDIDTLLVFIGLFTAIVTAFTIESYKWLQPDPSDTTNQLLFTVSQQLSGINVTVVDPSSPPTFAPESVSIRINAFWFTSIGISLFAALICIVCKQWLREYQRDASTSFQDGLALRQFRFDSLERWRIPEIIQMPALLLQGALFLFFAGLLDLLWYKLKSVAAIPLTILIGLAALFMLVTTLTPVVVLLTMLSGNLGGICFSPHTDLGALPCAYKSPQSWITLRLVAVAMFGLFAIVNRCVPYSRQIYLGLRHPPYSSRIQGFCSNAYRLRKVSSWLRIDVLLLEFIRSSNREDLTKQRWTFYEHYQFKGLSWIYLHLSQDKKIGHSLVPCFQGVCNEMYRRRMTWPMPPPAEERPAVEKTGIYHQILLPLTGEGEGERVLADRHSSALLEIMLRNCSPSSCNYFRLCEALLRKHIQKAQLNESTKSALWAYLYEQLASRPSNLDVADTTTIYAALWQPMGIHEPKSIARRFSDKSFCFSPDAWRWINIDYAAVTTPTVTEDFLEFYKIILPSAPQKYLEKILKFNSKLCEWGNLDPGYFDPFLPPVISGEDDVLECRLRDS